MFHGEPPCGHDTNSVGAVVKPGVGTEGSQPLCMGRTSFVPVPFFFSELLMSEQH